MRRVDAGIVVLKCPVVYQQKVLSNQPPPGISESEFTVLELKSKQYDSCGMRLLSSQDKPQALEAPHPYYQEEGDC